MSSINEIIKSSIRLARAKLEELQKELEKGASSLQKHGEKSGERLKRQGQIDEKVWIQLSDAEYLNAHKNDGLEGEPLSFT